MRKEGEALVMRQLLKRDACYPRVTFVTILVTRVELCSKVTGERRGGGAEEGGGGK
jgi:hypothetical protein